MKRDEALKVLMHCSMEEVKARYETALTKYYRRYMEGDHSVIPSTPSGLYMPKKERQIGCSCYNWWYRTRVLHQLSVLHLAHRYSLDEDVLKIAIGEVRSVIKHSTLPQIIELAMYLYFVKQLGLDVKKVDLEEYYAARTEES